MEQLHTFIYAKSNIATQSVRYLESVGLQVVIYPVLLPTVLCQLRFVTCVTTGVVMRELF